MRRQGGDLGDRLSGAACRGSSRVLPGPAPDMIEQLERLGQLRAQGILTDEEFAAQKARLLAG